MYLNVYVYYLPGEPEERLLKVVVGLGTNVAVLKPLLTVESDVLGLNLAVLHVNLTSSDSNERDLNSKFSDSCVLLKSSMFAMAMAYNSS
jgi:hypothetical protein